MVYSGGIYTIRTIYVSRDAIFVDIYTVRTIIMFQAVNIDYIYLYYIYNYFFSWRQSTVRNIYDSDGVF